MFIRKCKEQWRKSMITVFYAIHQESMVVGAIILAAMILGFGASWFIKRWWDNRK